MSCLQAPGLGFSWPVWSSLKASSLSWTTLSKASMESTTFSKRSGLGIGSLCRLASCSRVRSMFLSFRRTYQSLCKSSLLLFLSCWQVHEAPDLTFSSPQFFGSSKNSSSPFLDNVVWRNLHWRKDVACGVFLCNKLRGGLQPEWAGVLGFTREQAAFKNAEALLQIPTRLVPTFDVALN